MLKKIPGSHGCPPSLGGTAADSSCHGLVCRQDLRSRAIGAVVAQQLYTLWVGGSNPSSPTTPFVVHLPLAFVPNAPPSAVHSHQDDRGANTPWTPPRFVLGYSIMRKNRMLPIGGPLEALQQNQARRHHRLSHSNGVLFCGLAMVLLATMSPAQNNGAPSTGAVVPGGRAGVPSSGAIVPGGGTPVPSSGALVPGGRGVAPSGGTVAPAGGTPVPSSGALVPSGGAVVPSGGAVVPNDGTILVPQGGVVAPNVSPAPTAPGVIMNNGTSAQPLAPGGSVVVPETVQSRTAQSNNAFQTLQSNQFRTSTNNFYTPSTNGFAAPMTNNFISPSTNGFGVP